MASASSAPTTESTTVTVVIEWSAPVRVTLGLGDVLLMPKLQDLPGVYRIRIDEASGTNWVHVGEAAYLGRRMADHTRPGSAQSAVARLATRVREALHEGGIVTVATAAAITVEVDGQPAGVDLTRPADRRLALNAALFAARFEGVDQVLTVDDD